MKKFNVNDEGFICENCGANVGKLNYSSRDHCPYCLYSKHLDIFPGDRKNLCQGLMEPVDLEKFNNTYKIVYKCMKCGELHKNIMANDDDFDVIISLSSKKLNLNK